jgi:outer membrane protein assembly factor BamA
MDKYRLKLLVLIFSLLIAGVVSAGENANLVRNIHVEGLKRTQMATVLRELPFSEGSMWQDHFVGTSERRLRNLGIFSEVRVTPPDSKFQVNIYVRERWTLWVLPQASRKDDGSSSLSMVLDEYNLWGLNHHLRLSHKRETGKNFSDLTGSSSALGYNWQRIANSKLSMQMSAGWGSSLFDTYDLGIQTAQYLQTGKSGSLLFSYALGSTAGEGWGLSLGFSASNSTFRLFSGIPQPDVVGSRQRAVLSGISYRRINDRIVWLSGEAFDYSLAVAHNSLGSTFNSYRHTASYRNYYPFYGQNTLNFRINGGIVTGHALRSGLFDIGNRNGLRGYYPGELQGTSYFYSTLEGRFPIRQDSNFQLVAFADIGKIGGHAGSSVTKGIALGLGTGVRWTLRWLARGTIRADAAYGLASRRWRFYLGTGQAF